MGAVLGQGEVCGGLITPKLLCSYLRKGHQFYLNSSKLHSDKMTVDSSLCSLIPSATPASDQDYTPSLHSSGHGALDNIWGGPCVKHNFQVAREDKRTRDKKNKRYWGLATLSFLVFILARIVCLTLHCK